MSAVILAFPRRSPIQALCRAGDGSAPFMPAWCAQHLPLITAAMELLEAGDAEFASRCALMRDEDGRAMLDELAGQLQRIARTLPTWRTRSGWRRNASEMQCASPPCHSAAPARIRSGRVNHDACSLFAALRRRTGMTLRSALAVATIAAAVCISAPSYAAGGGAGGGGGDGAGGAGTGAAATGASTAGTGGVGGATTSRPAPTGTGNISSGSAGAGSTSGRGSDSSAGGGSRNGDHGN